MPQRPSQVNSQVFDAIRNDSELLNEIMSSVRRSDKTSFEGLWTEGVDVESMLETFADNRGVEYDSDHVLALEAIILRRGRPSFLIRDDDFVIPADERVWTQRLSPGRSFLKQVIRSVGRMEVTGHPDFQWLGTAWLVAPDLIVTNRHVATEFSRASGRDFVFLPGITGGSMGANIDFKEEAYRSQTEFVSVAKILFVARDGTA